MKTKSVDRKYDYVIIYLKYGKTKEMTLEAESREDARSLFWSRIEEMQAFTESWTAPFHVLSIRQSQ